MMKNYNVLFIIILTFLCNLDINAYRYSDFIKLKGCSIKAKEIYENKKMLRSSKEKTHCKELKEITDKLESEYDCNLDNSDLSNISPMKNEGNEFHLPNASIRNSSLYFSTLRGDFTNANFSNSDFNHADLSNAKLVGANLTDVKNLKNADLDKTDLSKSFLIGREQPINLSWGISIKKLNLKGAYLYNVDASFANLSETNFENATIIKTNFDYAILKNANFKNAKIDNDTTFIKADLTGATWVNGTICKDMECSNR